MPEKSLALLRSNVRNVYVIFSPSRMFTVKFNAVKEHLRVSDLIKEGRYNAYFAAQDLVGSSINAIAESETLRASFIRDRVLLSERRFASMWFYGDATSEFSREAAYLAVRSKMQILNLADGGSTLDRFLRLWIGRYGVLS